MSNSIDFSTESSSYYQSTDSIGISTEKISREIDFQKKLISKEIESEIQSALSELNTLSTYSLPNTIQVNTQKNTVINSIVNESTISTESSVKVKEEVSATSSPKNDVEFPNSNIFKYDGAISKASKKYNVPESLIHSVIKAESGYDENAKSGVGALGLMQLMPATAASLGVKNPMNPDQNIDGGVKYLSQMLKRYDGNLTFALAAYNAGPGNVDKYGGVPPFEETQNYVNKILNK